jgi:ATP-dependent protease ClpP protease subunit
VRRKNFRALLADGYRGERRVRAAATKPATSTSSGRAEIWMYGVIDSEEWWGDEITPTWVVQALQEVGPSDVLIHLNSPGGSVFAGISIFNTIKNHPGDVEIHVDGVAASAASVVMLGSNRTVIEPNAYVMIHDAWDMCVGNAGEMHAHADLLDRTSDNLASMYARRAPGMSAAEWRAVMITEKWYIGDEAVQAGLVDTVNDAGPVTDEVSARFNLSVYAHAPGTPAPAPVVPPHNRAPALDIAALQKAFTKGPVSA